jgi:AraC-like DNA-binding protein
MFRDQAAALCAPLIEETKAEIRHDRRHKATSVNVAKLLAGIEKDLVDPDLTVTELRHRCGNLEKNVSTPFTRDLGIGPSKYILGRRMEIASRALEASAVEVWRIGVQVGYLTPNSFTRAFKTWCEKTPEEFREEASAAGGAPPAPPPADAVSREEIERAVAGELPAAEAEAVVGRLGELQDRISANYQELNPPASDRYASEQMMAAYLWRCIEHEPHEIQKAAVESQAVAFHTPALFLVLSTASVEAAGTDADRATRLADLGEWLEELDADGGEKE